MSRESGEEIAPVVPQTHGVRPRHIQTSGIFILPTELIIEILAYFGNPRRDILSAKRARGPTGPLDLEHVERLTVLRKLTMICWQLRNMLFPLLWEYVEGCNVLCRGPVHQRHTVENGLYAQCAYLILNPTIGTHVQTLSVDLDFKNGPEDLSMKFFHCLALLPNLETLQIFSANDRGIILTELRRECAQFPSVRELGISEATVYFTGRCPNVESITARERLTLNGGEILGLYGNWNKLEKLKRLVGVQEDAVEWVVLRCRGLQEISIKGKTGLSAAPTTIVKATRSLRSLKHLAVLEIDLTASLFAKDELDTAESERRRAQIKIDLNAWKTHLIQGLRDSPSKERKFVRWKASEEYTPSPVLERNLVVVESGELEVFPEKPL